MNNSEREYLEKISKRMPKDWVKNLMVKKPVFEGEKERLEWLAKKTDNRELKKIIASGALDRTSEEVNLEITKKIDEFTTKAVQDGIRRGKLEPKEDSQAKRFRRLAGY